MRCPSCQTENPQENKFCRECGTDLLLGCPRCGAEVFGDDKFCGKCGQELEKAVQAMDAVPETDGERKHVTVLFSDLSGYTAMSERLDPEEVKEITTSIFSQISKVIDKYEGFVEKFVGDAVMALFGVPKAHEDDPIRAVKAAREIHELVDAFSPEVEKSIGQTLSMHTGINTGLVVTGEVDMEKGTHGVAGDTINLASRLGSLAKAGEILVSADTYRLAEGYYAFEDLEPTTVKGKTEPVKVYKVLSPKERPITVRRLSGLRADLIGRRAEMAQLGDAVEQLREGKGRIFSICGDAGTGKSRLIEEFKATCDLEEIQWLEGHAYAYSQNIPYFPLIDLLNEVFQIEEGDSPEEVRQKVESGVENLVGKKEDVVPYLGSLYSLSYPEIEEVSPEFWKSQLRDAVQLILSALAQGKPTIFLLEDLHWADLSFVELLRHILLEVRQPAIVLSVYRPAFSLFTTHELRSIAKVYQEIRIQDLSSSEAQDMLESILKTENIPDDLRRFVQNKAEGNPFYLEELVNSLIETETLIRDNGSWKLTKPITETDLSTTIHGVISGRIDRLERETKRILQEASVIGRAFLYEILKRITDLKQDIDRCLRGLEQLDLIRTRSLQPDLEYLFKHALTQEVVYNGLLKRERQEIHERIGLVMEQLFHDRLPEFYETLAFHFKQSQSINKAVDYLIKAGEKSLRRYAVEESHQYFKEAFDVLSNKPNKTRDEEGLLIDILLKWAFVFNHRGEFRGLADLFSAHQDLAESLDDKECLGMFYAWLGWGLRSREKLKGAYKYLSKALKLGEEVENNKVIGYACAWLTWTCADLGLLDEAIAFAKRAQKITMFYKSDKELFRFSIVGMGQTYWFRGESKKTVEAGKILLEYGQRESDMRCMTMGHLNMGWGYYAAGDLPLAIECYKRAIKIAPDPVFASGARLLLGMTYVASGQLQEAENMFGEVIRFSEIFGAEFIGTAGQLFQGIISITRGNLREGVRTVEDLLRIWLENGSRYRYALGKYMLGKLYLQIVQGTGPKSVSFLAKNIGFLVKNVPFADKKAEAHFNKTIEVGKEIGAKGVMGVAKLDLGMLHKAKGRTDQARECVSSAVQLFEECEAEVYLKQAKEVLASLE